MKKISLTKREKNILYITAGLVALALYFNLVADPLMDRCRILDREINLKLGELKSDITLLNKKTDIINKYRQYSAYQITDSDILREIESDSSSLGVRITHTEPGRITDSGYYKEYGLTIKAEGGLDSIYSLFTHLIESPYFLHLEKFMIYRSGQTFKSTIILSKIII